MANRKKISQEFIADILTTSRRRCCICFGLRRDTSEKKGQIAHLDSDSSNNVLDNLAFLCLDHHDQYDSRTSQSKGLTLEEVKRYRIELLSVMGPALEVSPSRDQSIEATEAEDTEDPQAALALARDVDERLAFEETRREWLTTRTGANEARSEFNRLCEALQQGSENRNRQMTKKSIVIRCTRYGEGLCVTSAKGLSLLVTWNCRSENTLDDAFLSVELYRQVSAFAKGDPIYLEKDSLYATEYSIDLEASSRVIWRRRDVDHKMCTPILVDFYLTDLLQRILQEQIS